MKSRVGLKIRIIKHGSSNVTKVPNCARKYSRIKVIKVMFRHLSNYRLQTQKVSLLNDMQRMYRENLFKPDIKSYIPLERQPYFFLANLFLKQDFSSEYFMVDFICMALLDL